MSNYMDKIKKNNTIERAEILSETDFFTETPCVTKAPMINVALSGDIDGGLKSGILTLAGDSKHFKTGFALFLASAYLEEHKDAVLLFYDTEFGTNQNYFESHGIDQSRVFHAPLENAEQLKFDLDGHLRQFEEGKDKLIIVIDSLGNMASKKEAEDAKDKKSVADMSRAKAFKGFFRLITGKLNIKKIPMIVINHTYDSQGFISKKVVSGGKGAEYAADDIWILGRQQDKETSGNDIKGYHFIINIEKSRTIREKTRIPISVSFEKGIELYSGLLDVAVEGKYIAKGKKGRSIGYSYINQETKETESDVFYEKDTFNKKFWDKIFDETDFKEYVKKRYIMIQNKKSTDADDDLVMDDPEDVLIEE